MHWLAETTAWLAFSHLILSIAKAEPQLAFPVNSQVPPVAYASKDYHYSFSPATFRSTTPPISYQIGNAPGWLSLDSNTRSFIGTPTEADVGAVTFQLIAKDEEGELSSSVTLVVVAKQTINLSGPITPYLQNSGSVSAPTTLLLRPEESFDIVLSADIFTGVSSQTTYYATSADDSPLPPWISLDSSSLTLSGTTPPLVSAVAAEQTYNFNLVATSMLGFSEAVVGFQIAVTRHILAFTKPMNTITVNLDQPFQSEPYRRSLMLDGKQVSDNELISVTATMPDWLQLDAQQIQLSGRPPSDLNTTEVIIVASDSYSNTANLSIIISAQPTKPPEASSTQLLLAYIGQDFSYVLASSTTTADLADADVDLGNASDWLTFTKANLTLHGHVPDNLAPQVIRVAITARESNYARIIQIDLQITQGSTANATASATKSIVTAVQTSSNEATSTGSESASGKSISNHRHVIVIGLSAGLPTLALAGFLLFFIMRKNRREKQKTNLKSQDEDDAIIISAPGINRPNETDESCEAPVVKMVSSEEQHSIQAPQIELFWSSKLSKKPTKRQSTQSKHNENASIGSSWEDLVRPFKPVTGGTTTTARDIAPSQAVTLTDGLSSSPLRLSTSKQEPFEYTLAQPSFDQDKRHSRVQSTITNRSKGLPQRLSGVGHGAAVLNSSVPGFRSSWQTTSGSIPMVDTRRESATLDHYPLSPSSDVGIAVSRPDSFAPNFRPTIRLIQSSSGQSEPLDAKLQKWHTERARDRLEGNAEGSDTALSKHGRITKMLPSNAQSSTIMEDDETDSQVSQHSFSKWSAIGPAAANDASNDFKIPVSSTHQKSRHFKGGNSSASSGQFDSAMSSDSQWEDENLVAEETEAGQRRWHTELERGTPSPRLPFEGYSSSQEDIGSNGLNEPSRRARLNDQRRGVSVEEGDLPRTQNSQRGSFRFI